MEELLKALGPWPVIQGVVIGLIVAAAGVWAFRKGILASRTDDDSSTIEEKRQEWAAYQQLENIEQNTFQLVAFAEKILEAIRSQNHDWRR